MGLNKKETSNGVNKFFLSILHTLNPKDFFTLQSCEKSTMLNNPVIVNILSFIIIILCTIITIIICSLTPYYFKKLFSTHPQILQGVLRVHLDCVVHSQSHP